MLKSINPSKKKKKQYHLIKPWIPYAFTSPIILIMLFIVVIPLLFGFLLSGYDVRLNNMRLIKQIGLEIYKFPFVFKDFVAGGNFLGNYYEIFTDLEFWKVFARTVVWTIVNVTFHVVLGVYLAVTINRRFPLKGIFRVLIILPWAIPQYIAVLSWRIGLFNVEYGAINTLLKKLSFLGLQPVNWLIEPTAYFIACIIVNIWLGVPFMMMVASGGLQSIPKDLYEAAEIDGANPLQQFWKITAPLLRPVLAPAIMLGCVWTFNMVNIIYLMDPYRRPSDKVNILVVKMYRDGFDLYRYGYAAAMAVAIFIVLLIFSIVFMKATKFTEE